MPKSTKYIFSVLFILSAAAVLGAGLLFVGFLTQQHWGKKVTAPTAITRVDPETLPDDAVQASGLNFVQKKAADGELHPVAQATYVSYLADNGTYQPIDTAIKPTSGEYAHENTTNVFQTFYKESAADPDFIKFAVAGGRSLSFSFADGAAGTPQVKGNAIAYPEVLPGMDSRYTLSSEQMLEELVVEKKIALTGVTQHLKLTGVYYKEQPDGSITFHDLTTKKEVFFIPRPVMYEQRGQANKNYNLHYEITKEPGGFLLTKVIDAEGQRWLEQASYPIVIDAPVGILPPASLTIRTATTLTAGGVPRVDSWWSVNTDTVNTLGYLVQYSTNNWTSATTVCDIPNTNTASWTACGNTAYGNFTGKGEYFVLGATMEFHHFDADPNATVYYRVAAYGTAQFGTGGVVTDTSFSGANVAAFDIQVDETERGDCGNYGCMYLSGLNANAIGRIMQKRRLDNGALVTSFGTNGTVTADTSSYRPYSANGFAMDSTYIYIGGNDSTNAPFLEKRFRSTGAVSVRVTNAALINPNLGIISDVQVDVTYVYSVGEAIVSGSLQWYGEKRRVSDLALCTNLNCGAGAWGAGGYFTEPIGGQVQNGLRGAIDATYLYFIGEAGNNPAPLRMEKRLLTTGVLQTSVNSVTGYQANLLSNLIVSGTNLVLFYTNNSNQWSLERRLTSDLSLPASLSGIGYRAGGLAANGDTLFAGGMGTAPDSRYSRSLVSNLGANTWTATAASIASSKALAIDTDYVYTFGTNSSNQWRIEKRKQSDGSLGNTPCVTGQSGFPACLQYSTASTPAYRYARTTAVSSTLTAASTAWSTIQVTGVPNPPTSTPKTNPNSTELCFGYDHSFWNGVNASDVRYLDSGYRAALSTTAGNPDMINDTFPEPQDDWCHSANMWNGLLSFGPFPVSQTSEGNYLYPNRLYSVGMYARQFNSTDGNGSRLTPPTVTASLYTYPRQVVAPTLTATATATELKVNIPDGTVNTSIVDDPAVAGDDRGYTNPSTTQYSVKLSSGMYMIPSANGAISASEQWGTYAQWGGASGIVNTSVPAGNCYTVTVRSRTDGAPTLYAAASAASAQVCLPLAPPLQPGVACSWSGADYRCLVNNYVNPLNPADPPTPLYYQIEYRKGGSWTDLFAANNWQRITSYTHTALSCDANNMLEYRVLVSLSPNGTVASLPSSVGSNALPPCQPTTPVGTPIDYQTISWAWSPGPGTAVSYYRLRDTSLNVYIPSTVPPGVSSPYTQTGLKPNSNHTMYVDPYDGNNRIGQNSTTSSPGTHTLAILPSSVSITSCSYSAPSYQCTIQINDQSANSGYNGNAANCSNPGVPCTFYRIQVCLPAIANCGLDASWAPIDPTSFGQIPRGDNYFYKFWGGVSQNQTFTFNDQNQPSFMTCNANDTQQMYRVQVKNHDGIATAGAATSAVATLPPCQVTFPTPNHDSQTNNQLRWLWNAPSGGAPVSTTSPGYEVKTVLAGNCTAPNAGTFTPAECYLADTVRYYLEGGLTVNKSYSATIRARDSSNRWGKPATASAYTSIEPVTVASYALGGISGVSETGMQANASPTVTNINLRNSGIQFFMNAVGQNWARLYSFPATGLTPNTKYCFQAQSRNGDGDPGLPDTNDPLPVSGQCYYTWAAKPIAPRLVRQMSETLINVIVKPNETPPNPQVPPNDTEYALCVTKYDAAGNPLWSHYANPNLATGLIDHDCSLPQYDTSADCTSHAGTWTPQTSCNSTSQGGPPPQGDGNKYWANRVNWGSDSGKPVDLVTAGKYDFKLKARSGDSVGNGTCAGGNVQSDGRCRETAFGSPATLFLVKNNLVGWAWSNKVGWISLNCLNRYNQSEWSCGVAGDWGVNTWFEPSRDINPVEGYAWSSSGQALKEVITTSQVNLNAAPVKAMAYDNAGYLWVSKSERTAGVQNPLYKINISTGQIVQSYLTIPADQALWRLVFDGTDLWGVTTSESLTKNLLYRISTADGSIKETIPLCVSGCNINATLGGMAYDGTDFWIVASTGGFNDVLRVRRSATAGQTKEFNCDGTDPGAGTPTRCIVGNGAQQTYYDGRYVWVNNYSAASVSRITPATGQVRTIAIPGGNLYPVGIASDGNYLWVSHKDSGYTVDRYSVMNITTEAWIATNDLSANAASTPGMIAYDGTYMWIAGYKSDKVFQVRASTRQLVATNTFNQNPYMVVVAGGSVWVGNHVGGTNKDITEVYKEYPTQKTGLGWVSFDKYVCSNNSQKGCSTLQANSPECGGAPNNCVASTGASPNGDPTYGFCYTDATSTGVKYGKCSDNSQPCNDGNLALCADQSTAKCVWETCKNPPGNTCTDYGAGAEVCRDYTTANFSGTTRQIEGWARILSSKDSGAALGFTDWGWIKLNGTYNDGQGNTGPYGVTGTEVDSQQFFGDPDVNPNDLKLYSMFGWGWNAQTSNYTSKSSWLPAVNVSQTKGAMSHPITLDSKGNPHVAWIGVNGYYCSYNSSANPGAACTTDAQCGTGKCTSNQDVFYLHWNPQAGQWVDYNYEKDGIARNNIVVPNVFAPSRNCLSTEHVNIALDAQDHASMTWDEADCSINSDDWKYVGLYAQHWDGTNWIAYANAVSNPCPGGAYRPTCDSGSDVSMVLDKTGYPNIAWTYATSPHEIHFRRWDGTNWVTVTGQTDATNVRVDNTTTSSDRPSLSLDASGNPHIAWHDSENSQKGNVYYRYWDSSHWVTASGAWGAVPGQNDADINVSQIFTFDGGNPLNGGKYPSLVMNGTTPYIAFAAYRQVDGQYRLYFRKWNGSAWVTASNDATPGDGGANLMVDSASITYNGDDGDVPSLAVGPDGNPRVAWGDRGSQEIYYRAWNSSSNAWVSAYGDASTYLNVSSTSDESRSPSLALDRFGNMHVSWIDRRLFASTPTPSCSTCCETDLGVSSDQRCINTDYPFCQRDYGAPNLCSRSDVMYTKWAPGMAQGGLGWVEFMPAGALLGIPWVQTMFADIHASQNISLAPPPRGTGDYTSTYLIETGGAISGIPGYYGGTTTGSPTSQLPEQPGFSPLVQNKPSIQTLGSELLGKLDVDGLVTKTNGNKNRHGTVVVDGVGTVINIDSAFTWTTPGNTILNNKVYYFHGAPLYQINSVMTFMRGDSIAPPKTYGNGVIVIDGNLEINADMLYDPATNIVNLIELPSAAIIVRGNIYINSLTSQVSAVVAAIDNPATTTLTEGFISTGRKAPASYQVSVSADDTWVNTDGLNQPTASRAIFGRENAMAMVMGNKIGQSSDGGTTWNWNDLFGGSGEFGTIQDYLKATDGKLYVIRQAGTTSYLEYSRDNGVTWDRSTTPATSISSLAEAQNGDIVVGGGSFNVAQVFEIPKYQCSNSSNTLGGLYKPCDATHACPGTEVCKTSDLHCTGGTQGLCVTTADCASGTCSDYNFNFGMQTTVYGTCSFNATRTCIGTFNCSGGSWGVCNNANAFPAGFRLARSLAVSPTNPGKIYTVSDTTSSTVGVFSWQNSGSNWACNLSGAACTNSSTCPNGGSGTPTGQMCTTWANQWIQIGNAFSGATGNYYKIIEDAAGVLYSGGANDLYVAGSTGPTRVYRYHAPGPNWADLGVLNTKDNSGNPIEVSRVNTLLIGSNNALYAGAQTSLANNYGQLIFRYNFGTNSWVPTGPVQAGVCKVGATYTTTTCQLNSQCGTGNTCQLHNVINVSRIVEGDGGVLYAAVNTSESFGSGVSHALAFRSRDFGASWEVLTDLQAGSALNILAENSSGPVNMLNRDALRFPLTVPAGAEIKNAYLRLQSDGTGSGDFNARILLLDGDNAGSIDFTSNPNSTLYNAPTSNSVNFPISGTWTADSWYNSPNLKALVQRFVNRDNYSSGNYIGLTIREGDAVVGMSRGFRTFDSGATNAPQLVIEYAPRRVTYPVTADETNDATAWSAGYSSAAGCNTFGYDYSSTIHRTFLRFPTLALPAEAEILGAKIQGKNCNPNAQYGNKGFELRQGLVTGYPASFTTNPYLSSLDSTVAEVSQTLTDGQLATSGPNIAAGSGSRVTFTDITRLVQTFIARSDYVPGSTDNSAMVIRLRGGSDNTESTLGTLQWRGIDSASFTPATLNVDYQIPLSVSGLFVAGTGYNFDRKYTKNLAPAEQILYDGRVVANTPPGLADFIKALPIYHRVTP